jgi:oligopeptide transport system permease protein
VNGWLKQRLLVSLTALLLVFLITFLLIRFLPGDPFLTEQGLPEKSHQALRDHWKLDDAWYQQLFSHVRSIISFDFGTSITYPDRTVKSIIWQALPISIQLGMSSVCLALFLGVSSAVLTSIYDYQTHRVLFFLFTTLLLSMPTFLVAALLQYFVGTEWGWLPVARWGSWEQLILPSLSLALGTGAFLGNLLYVRIQKELDEPYVRFAEAKGLSHAAIILKHVLRNAIIPLLAYLGPFIANVATGSFIIEKIFAIPGLGYWFVQSVGNRDYPLIVALVLLYCSVLLVCVFLSDLAIAWADPRQRTQLYKKAAA